MIPNNEPYLIGETAFHHQGDLDYLKKLIQAAADLKLNAIKFHLLFDVGDYFVSTHPAFSAIGEWVFTKETWSEIFNLAESKGLDIIALCNDEASINWVNEECKSEIKAIELHATGINDVFLLSAASKFSNTVMLGVGGSTLDQVKYAIDLLKGNKKEDIFLMYGFQNYPTDYKDINLDKISLIRDMFQLPVGYADHTDPVDVNNEIVSTVAILKGVNVLEKHFTLDVTEKRVDSQAAVSLKQMEKIKELSQLMFIINGKGGLDMSEAELKYGDTGPMKKAIVARNNISKDQIIEARDLAYKRTESSSYIEQKDFYSIVGLKATENIETDEVINYSNVEYKFNVSDVSQFLLKK